MSAWRQAGYRHRRIDEALAQLACLAGAFWMSCRHSPFSNTSSINVDLLHLLQTCKTARAVVDNHLSKICFHA